uniref:Uncharacterized protein n=1 Tax=Aureoumbra lagunensis TaxID=44058 RepID=A0A7S3JWQ5_9STRA
MIQIINTRDGKKQTIKYANSHIRLDQIKEIAIHPSTKDLYLIDSIALWKIGKFGQIQQIIQETQLASGLAITNNSTIFVATTQNHILSCFFNTNQSYSCSMLFDFSDYGSFFGGLSLDYTENYLFAAIDHHLIIIDHRTKNLIDFFDFKDSSLHIQKPSDILFASDGFLYLTTNNALIRFHLSSFFNKRKEHTLAQDEDPSIWHLLTSTDKEEDKNVQQSRLHKEDSDDQPPNTCLSSSSCSEG